MEFAFVVAQLFCFLASALVGALIGVLAGRSMRKDFPPPGDHRTSQIEDMEVDESGSVAQCVIAKLMTIDDSKVTMRAHARDTFSGHKLSVYFESKIGDDFVTVERTYDSCDKFDSLFADVASEVLAVHHSRVHAVDPGWAFADSDEEPINGEDNWKEN